MEIARVSVTLAYVVTAFLTFINVNNSLQITGRSYASGRRSTTDDPTVLRKVVSKGMAATTNRKPAAKPTAAAPIEPKTTKAVTTRQKSPIRKTTESEKAAGTAKPVATQKPTEKASTQKPATPKKVTKTKMPITVQNKITLAVKPTKAKKLGPKAHHAALKDERTKASTTKSPSKADIVEKSRQEIAHVLNSLDPYKEFLIMGSVLAIVLFGVSCCCCCICR